MPATSAVGGSGVVVATRDERNLRIWSAIAMWLGGAMAVAVALVLSSEAQRRTGELMLLIGWCVLAALFSLLVFPRASNRTLYLLNNIFSTLGALTVALACFLSGGASSGLMELYFFPVLYDAYFFRARDVSWHLVVNSLLVLAPLLYSGSAVHAQFPGHALVLVVAFFSMSVVIWRHKQRMLLAEAAARRQALSDPLTGLHNLRGLKERADSLGDGCSLLAIDLDDFKAVNSRYGHVGADRLLRAVADGLLDATRDDDCVARIGGDEFAVLGAARSDTELEQLRLACADAVRGAVARAELAGPPLTASVGLAVYPRDGLDLAALLAVSDRAMFAEKASFKLERADGSDSPTGGAERHITQRALGSADMPQVATPSRVATWRRVPSHARTTAAAWLGAAAITAAIELLPGAEAAHRPWVLLLAGLAIAIAGGLLRLSLALPAELFAAAGDVLATACLAVAVALTGGTTSPMLPCIFLAVAVGAYFFTPQRALASLGTGVLVCASPLLYTGSGLLLDYVVRFVALTTTALVLTAIISYNKRELVTAQRTAQDLAERDPLTGLPNRRAFYAWLEDMLAGHAQGAAPAFATAIIDLDNFKRVNDRHGHAAGDEVLRAIGSSLRAAMRRGDRIARIGGDEFALVAAGVDVDDHQALGIRCIQAVEQAAAAAGYADCRVSATVGFGMHSMRACDADGLVSIADESLMRAKAAGKRRVAAPEWGMTPAYA